MDFPILTPHSLRETGMDTFGGYDHNPRIPENSFFDLENMTSDGYPLLRARGPRGRLPGAENVTALLARDCLCRVEGPHFVINGYRVYLGLSAGEKQLVNMGAYVIIFPDKVYINTADLTDFGSLEAEYVSAAPVTFTPCDMDGNTSLPDYVGQTPPDSPQNGQLWLDTEGLTLLQWSESGGLWAQVPQTFVRISAAGIGRGFAPGDGITLTGLEGSLTDAAGSPIPDPRFLYALGGAAVLEAVGQDFVVLPGLLGTTVTLSQRITLGRYVPETDFVTESGNRLWACRFGPDRSGAFVNEIYATKLGDFKNWQCFRGLSTDSFTLSLGDSAPFTGAAVHLGQPVFFREGCIHRIYGQLPENFRLQTTSCQGVKKGCHNSIAQLEGNLLYQGEQGIFRYDGSLPRLISQALGRERYRGGRAAASGGKYYIALEDEAGQQPLFVYDSRRNLWHKESPLPTRQLCAQDGEIYSLSPAGTVITLLGSGEPEEETVTWMARTGLLGITAPGGKRLHKLSLGLSLGAGSELRILARYDSAGPWETLGRITRREAAVFSLPLLPRRCGHMELRLEGRGEMTLHAVTKTMSEGGMAPW